MRRAVLPVRTSTANWFAGATPTITKDVSCPRRAGEPHTRAAGRQSASPCPNRRSRASGTTADPPDARAGDARRPPASSFRIPPGRARAACLRERRPVGAAHLLSSNSGASASQVPRRRSWAGEYRPLVAVVTGGEEPSLRGTATTSIDCLSLERTIPTKVSSPGRATRTWLTSARTTTGGNGSIGCRDSTSEGGPTPQPHHFGPGGARLAMQCAPSRSRSRRVRRWTGWSEASSGLLTHSSPGAVP